MKQAESHHFSFVKHTLEPRSEKAAEFYTTAIWNSKQKAIRINIID